MKKVWTFIALIIVLPSLCLARSNELQLSLSAGMSHVFRYGSVEDYVFAENDFPVTPAHNSFNVGIALSYFLVKGLGFELDTRFFLSPQVILEDPSDQDTVKIDTSSHFSISLNYIYKFLNGKIQPYLAAGGGIDKMLGKDQTAVTAYGFEIQFGRPEKTVDLTVNAGGGIQYILSSRMGIRLDVRYTVIFGEQSLTSLNPTLGIFIGF